MQRFALTLCLIFVTRVAAIASPTPAPSAPPAAPLSVETSDAVTQHAIALDGKTLAYTARAGTIELRDGDEHPTAHVFYVAYTLDGAPQEHRPITFFYNGGPGSSTMWLHMGSFGPQRVETSNGTMTGPPPYHVVDNQDSLLDASDLVFIDMPDSGFGRIVSGKEQDFFGVDQDVHAFAQFVTRYITTFNRWNSPKFLYGESYGTTRTAALVAELQQQGVEMNGIVLQSSYLNAAVDIPDSNITKGGDDWPFAFYLPTEAATAWYHDALPRRPAQLEPFLTDVANFAMGEYMDALAQGAAISPSLESDVVAKLHDYLGLSEQYIRNADLRVPYWNFENELLRDKGLIVGRLDGRFQTYSVDRLAASAPWDPTEAAINGPFTVAVNEYLRETLRYRTSLPYRGDIYDLIQSATNGKGWDESHNGLPVTDVAPDLAQALTLNPNLKVFSANGYFDFATPYLETDYVLNHLNIDRALQSNITYGYYQSGHMIYLEPQARHQLHDDLERWYSAVLGSR
jgi:carboxypeptidase C (cathepsin A)